MDTRNGCEMTVVNRLQHPAVLLSAVVILLSSLACVQSSGFATFTPAPVSTVPAASPLPPTRTATIPTSTDAATPQTAKVVRPVVRVHEAPESKEIAGYVYEGDAVTVNGCSENWCSITSPVTGYVYQGCLSELAGERKCEADK
jgi:hypothetical protein